MAETQLPGEQWAPSNGTEGAEFMDRWCRRCSRDKAMREGADFDECDDNELCSIIADSAIGQAVEWRELTSGETICTAFVSHEKTFGETQRPPNLPTHGQSRQTTGTCRHESRR